MSITKYRQTYKPFEYPQYFEVYQDAFSAIWRPEEVDLQSDLRDWNECTDDERDIISGILRGFTLMECDVSCYWGETICKLFPKHEIQAVARLFSFNEVIHSQAYNYLSDTLGLNEFEAFLGDPYAQKKLNDLQKFKDPLTSLAIFSGAGEGVSLFSSFAVLLSFNYYTGRFKGLMQIISWSALDEQLHSHVGCSLFKELVKEQGLTNEQKQSIIEGFDLIVQNEIAFVSNIFKSRASDYITGDQLIAYIYYRANERLRFLGLTHEDLYKYDRILCKKIRDWFEPIISGNSSTDFFSQAKDGANYISKPTLDRQSVNLKEIYERVKKECI